MGILIPSTRFLSALLIATLILAVNVVAVSADSQWITLDKPTYMQGDRVTITTSLNANAAGIEITNPKGTIIYLTTATNSTPSRAFKLPSDCVLGNYTLTATRVGQPLVNLYFTVTAPPQPAPLPSNATSTTSTSPTPGSNQTTAPNNALITVLQDEVSALRANNTALLQTIQNQNQSLTNQDAQINSLRAQITNNNLPLISLPQFPSQVSLASISEYWFIFVTVACGVGVFMFWRHRARKKIDITSLLDRDSFPFSGSSPPPPPPPPSTPRKPETLSEMLGGVLVDSIRKGQVSFKFQFPKTELEVAGLKGNLVSGLMKVDSELIRKKSATPPNEKPKALESPKDEQGELFE